MKQRLLMSSADISPKKDAEIPLGAEVYYRPLVEWNGQETLNDLPLQRR
jgi:hypothetical protein